MIGKRITGLLLCAGVALMGAPLKLAKGGKPLAEIIRQADAHPAVQFAAEELQKWVKAISGAELPILDRTGAGPVHIVLAVKPTGFDADLKQLAGNDGYAARTNGATLTILGSRPKGVLNGVFRLLFRNTDIIWARPAADIGTCYSCNPDLTLSETDYIDVPVYKLRGWQMGRGLVTDEEWQVRNACNWSAASIAYRPNKVKYDPTLEYGSGHNLVGIFIPERKYYATHPEYFPLIDGKRARPSDFTMKTQLCFTNPGMLQAFITEVDERIKANPAYETYRIMIEDNYKLCQCPECMKDIILPDGKTVNSDDPAFRSTQFFMFLNQIARHLKRNYPGKRILTFAYFFTEIPPKCQVEDNISMSFCPIYKNSKYPITAPENKLTMDKFQGWLAVSKQLTWREYYGLCSFFPRPIDIIALQDWKYVNSFGIDRTYSEMRSDTHDIYSGDLSWDLNSMYFWVLANSPWDPSQDVHEMRNTFLKRVYGAAADDVRDFYAIIEKSWFAIGGDSKWNDKAHTNWNHCVMRPGLDGACKSALERAAAKVKPDSNGAKMLAAMRNILETQCKMIPIEPIIAKPGTPQFEPDFKDSAWSAATPAVNFVRANGNPLVEKTAVKVLYDNNNLYIAARCDNAGLNKLTLAPAGSKRDKWLPGEKFETFIVGKDFAGKDAAFQFVVTPNGNVFDTMNRDPSWNGDFTWKTARTKTGWSIMLTVPFKTIGFTDPPPQCKIMFIRYISFNRKNSTFAVWNDGTPNDSSSYIMMKLAR